MNLIPASPAPEFKEIAQWSDGLSHTIREFKGKAILLDFWTYTCIFCLRTIPTIKSIKDKFEDKGLVILPIHSAEYEFAKDLKNITKAMQMYNMDDFSIGYDSNNKTWEAYGNSYWPKHILIDKDGFIRFEHAGYGRIENFEEAIADVLEINDKPTELSIDPNGQKNIENLTNKAVIKKETQINSVQEEIIKTYGMYFPGIAPEICVGYSRLKRFGNNQKLKINEYNIMTLPEIIFDNIVYLKGKWRWDKEGIKADLNYKEKNPAIVLKYNMAYNVNIICKSDNEEIATAEIKIDGNYINRDQIGIHTKIKNEKSIIETSWPFINNIIKTKEKEKHIIEIIPQTENFYFYTFVFG